MKSLADLNHCNYKLVGKLSPDPDSNDEELEHMQFVQMMTDMDIS